jgi:DNA-directed RNA polymerase specialized sigma24 family protein
MTTTEALKQLEPTQRKALFMYKKERKTVAQIAQEMSATEDVVLDLLRNARRHFGEIMKGARA